MNEGEFSKHIGVSRLDEIIIESGALGPDSVSLYERILENSRPGESEGKGTENSTDQTKDMRQFLSMPSRTAKEFMKTWTEDKLLAVVDIAAVHAANLEEQQVRIRAGERYWRAIRSAATEILENRDYEKYDATEGWDEEMERLVEKGVRRKRNFGAKVTAFLFGKKEQVVKEE